MKITAQFQNRTRLYLNLLALSIIFLPFRNNISSVIGIIIFLFFIVDKENRLIDKLKGLLVNKLAILTLSIYLIHLIGLIYTSNFKYASLDLEIKLPLFILPLVIFSERKLSFENLNYLFKFLTIGNIIALLICCSYSLYRFYITKSPTVLFYNEFSRFMHPSYFSLYVGFNCLYMFYKISLLNKLEIKFKRKLTIYLIVSLLLIFGILILSSKAGILITGLALVFFALKELLYKKIILLILLTFIGILVLYMNSIFHNKIQALSRFEEAKKELSTKSNYPNENSGSSNSRLEIWKSCKSIVLNNLAYGVGTGDIKDELMKQYKKVNFEYGIVNQNNCHNQYLQFFILFGLGGGLLFLISLFYPTYISLQNNNILYLYFMFFMLTNMLVESMLESKAGVEFFALFNAILLNYVPRINK